VRYSAAYRRHWTEHAGKYLTRAAEFDPRLDDVANPGHAHRVTRSDDIERGAFDPPVLQHAPRQIIGIDFKDTVAISMRDAEANLAHRKFCYLKFHRKIDSGRGLVR
jgi:hypothetical protein